MRVTFIAEDIGFLSKTLKGELQVLVKGTSVNTPGIGTVTVESVSPVRGDPSFMVQLAIGLALSVPVNMVSDWLFELIKKGRQGNREIEIKMGNGEPIHISYSEDGKIIIGLHGKDEVASPEMVADIVQKAISAE
jgi:hypothetical protein